ncbi:multicopper oxidase domain-containing protein [Amycolatopsis aidingensis]|uniref:multicopper oxidase domain-containing protein n=1 Tax=Amycolatopsis aidingensis TaxID=2842453 RepID=UPI001E33EE91|nr:multicopper oxidase domain-containing protein [Amycolatopsis aidingensis]
MSEPLDLRPPGRPPRGFKGPFIAWGNLLVLAWLAVAVLLFAVHRELGLPVWLPLHAFLLGSLTNAIVVWSMHFVVALCRVPSPSPRRMGFGLGALNVSVLLVLLGVGTGVHWVAGTGAAGITVLATVHAIHLLRLRRHALTGGYGYLVGYYAAAAVALAIGGTLGGALTAGGMGLYARLLPAHAHLNLFGWLGLSVLGTLFTLWPTALRTRMPADSMRLARRVLPLLLAGLAAMTAGFVLASAWTVLAGLVAYAIAAGVSLAPFELAMLRQRPRRPAPWMLAAASFWFVAAVLIEAGLLLGAGKPDAPAMVVGDLLPVLVVGFGAQILTGALTQLLPVVLGRGPAEHKRVAAVLGRAWQVRVIGGNVAAVLVAVDLPTPLPSLGWVLAAICFGAFVLLAMSVTVPVVVRGALPASNHGGATTIGIAVGLAATVGAVLLGAGGAPGSPEPSSAAPVRTVQVELAEMRIDPPVVRVPPGTRLMLRVVNNGAAPHDLRLANGARTDRLGSGDSELLDAGVIDGTVDGWCTITGHRAAGMTMTIRPAGDGRAGPEGIDPAARPGPGWRPRDAALPPADAGTLHRVELRVSETELELAPGHRQRRWTFGGTTPGPTLRGEVGDRFEITLVNDGSLGHGVDFHAGALAPEEPMRTIAPGERLVYRFTARRAGAWLYHCSATPMSQHIANGMYGAVIIDPPRLPPVDREYLLVGAQLYAGEPGSDPQVAKIDAGAPDGWQFNGTAGQYVHAPLAARAGERVRFWVVNAGPGGTLSFHVVGGQFDTVYREGAWALRPGADGGAQTLGLAPAQGGFAELTFPEPGRYPFVDHDMRHAEGGARGFVDVVP